MIDIHKKAAAGTLRKMSSLDICAGDVVLDLGANCCHVANALAAAGAKVVAYEPFPVALSIAQPAAGVELRRKAVTADGRDVEMAIDKKALERGYTCSAHVQDTRVKRSNKALFDGVPSDAIASVIAEVNPTVVKMDVEQSEYELLPNINLSNIRAVMVEFHNLSSKGTIEKFVRCFWHLIDSGFAPTVGWPKNGPQFEVTEKFDRGWFKGFGPYWEVVFVKGAELPANINEVKL